MAHALPVMIDETKRPVAPVKSPSLGKTPSLYTLLKETTLEQALAHKKREASHRRAACSMAADRPAVLPPTCRAACAPKAGARAPGCPRQDIPAVAARA